MNQPFKCHKPDLKLPILSNNALDVSADVNEITMQRELVQTVTETSILTPYYRRLIEDQEHDGQYDEEQDDVNEKTDSDNDGDEFVHPKLSTHDEEDKEEEDSDPRVHTPSNYESTNDEESDKEIQGANVEGEEMDEEETNEEDEANELYRDVNVNLEGRDTEMTDAPCTIVQTTQVIEDTHVIITTVNPEAQQHSSSMSSGFISNMLNPSQDTAVSSILGIVDAYLANKIHEAVKTVVQLQSDRLRDEAQAENANFINKLDDNIKKIIKDQVKEQVSKILPKIKKTVNEKLEAEVLTRSSNESKTSHAVTANLSDLELKNILIDNMETNKLIHISDEQKNLYKALVDAYESNKLILDTYGETVSFKSHRDEEDKDEEPSGGSNRGSAEESAQAEEPMQTAKDSEEPTHQEPVQPWLSSLAHMEDPRESFNELMDTPLDFSAFVMNRLKVDTLTPELLAGPTFKLMKGSCKSLVELEYFFEEVNKNKDKKNRLMRINELHKFSDDTLNDVRTTLDDRLKGIRMKYLPQTIWRQSDRDKAGAMIQAIDKQLKTRRIMRSLERFVGGRLYGGDLRMLQRTI
ncbi:hypothetical protein Tco_0520368 [Tanacetum coccineum]